MILPKNGGQVGETISHYRILEKLGEGGMGMVYKAVDTKLKRKVALKFLPHHLLSNEEDKTRFLHEAQVASALSHPNIMTIYEIDEVEGQIFIAMELVEGETLKEVIGKGPSKTNELLRIAVAICEGLNAAHERDVIHRDIKSENIMITNTGLVKIMDFGLAKRKGMNNITKAGTTMGTLDYMSPEQAGGKNVDHRTDLWSFGVVLYEMSTSRLPFAQEYEAATIYSIVNENPPPPSDLRDDIPLQLEKVILKCLRKGREGRFSSARALLSELQKLKDILETEKVETIVDESKKPETREETERRIATVMSVAVSGYNEMLQNLDEEEAASIMNKCFERFATIAEKYGSKTDKIIGNNFMVLFGVPTAIEDAPKRAINAAIEMRNSLSQLNLRESPKIHLNLRVGIHTGMVIAGALGTDEKKDYSIMGDTVNFASALKEESGPGQICVGPLTYKYTKNEFHYKNLEPVSLKGREELVPVFELLSTKEKVHRARLGTERMIYSEMVGRAKELDKLELHVLKVINGEGSIVSVIGQPGIGKSRLVAELKRKDAIKRVTFIEGRALSIGRNLSYHPIIDFLKNWARIKEGDTQAESIHKLEKAITVTYPEGASEVFPFIATLMGMKITGRHAERIKGIEGEPLEKLIVKSLREFVTKAAELRPTVFVFEDLHWADLTSIEFLESLYRLVDSNRTLFVNVLRPDYEETGDRLLRTIRERYADYHSEIRLERLEEDESRVLIGNLLRIEGFSPRVRELITKRTEGNPFFIEEIVRSFIDGGVVKIRDGHFEVTEKIDSAIIPETIQDVLMTRIDRLDEKTRSLVKTASVIGREFFYKILVEVARTSEEIDDKLSYLKEVELIRERKRMEEVEYLFKHALVQEATYESILLKKRKELHLRTANAIESVFSDRTHEFYGMLALHYSRAENLEKAEEYLVKAGEQALKAAASSEALHYYQEALKLYLKKYGDSSDPDRIADLEKNIGIALLNKGRMAEAVEHLDKVLDYWGEKRSRNKIVALLSLISKLLNISKNAYFPSKRQKKTPTERDQHIIDLTEKRGLALTQVDVNRLFVDSLGLGKRLYNLDISRVVDGPGNMAEFSVLFAFSGILFKLSRPILEYARDHVSENDLRSVLSLKTAETMHDYATGNWGERHGYDEYLVDRNLRAGRTVLVSYYTANCCVIAGEQGNFGLAQICIDKLHSIDEDYESDEARGQGFAVETRLLLKNRRLSDALEVADKGIAFAGEVGHNFRFLFISAMEANIHLLLEDISKAEISLRRAREAAGHEGRIAPLYLSNLLLSQFLFDLHSLDESINSNDKQEISKFRKKTYDSGNAVLKNTMKYALDKTEAFRLLGLYYWLTRNQKKALKWWGRSIEAGEQLGARPELARSYMEIGKRLLERGSEYRELNGIDADEYLGRARTLFEEMDLEWDLSQLNNISGVQ